MVDVTNPFTGTPYHSWSDVEQDLKDHPECKQKIYAIARRIQEVLSHEQIRRLCGLWGCVTPGEFWKKLNGMSDAELKAYVDRVKGRKKNQAKLEAAVLVSEVAGVA